MKKIGFLTVCLLMILCLLAGCRSSYFPETTGPVTVPPSSQPTAGVTTAPTESPTTAPTETVPPEATQATQEVPYLLTVPRADQSIFSGPGYDYSFVGTVELAGVYTVVEEAEDAEGNLWGKLKSGIGWINLTEIRSPNQTPISANYADQTLLDSGNYHHCKADSSEYAVSIAFRAQEPLRDVAFTALDYTEAGFQVRELLYQMDRLDPEKPLVVEVSFPGDLTTYGIRFTDSEGIVRRYTVTISGRNGSLVLTEYLP